MIQSVPALSIAIFAINAVIILAIPIAALIIIVKKTKCNPVYILAGAGTFIVFALILETLLHQVVFHFFGETLTGNIWLYALYGGLTAGLFEETGRYISMKLFMKKALTKQNSLIFGVGHGGAEAIIVGAMTAFSNIVMSVMINTGQIDKLLSTVDSSQKEAAVAQLSALSTTPAGELLLGGFERLSAFGIQICLSYIVYRAVKNKKPLFYILAVAIHFAVDASLAVLAKYIPLYCVEIILAAETVCMALIVFNKYKSEKEETESTEIQVEQ